MTTLATIWGASTRATTRVVGLHNRLMPSAPLRSRRRPVCHQLPIRKSSALLAACSARVSGPMRQLALRAVGCVYCGKSTNLESSLPPSCSTSSASPPMTYTSLQRNKLLLPPLRTIQSTPPLVTLLKMNLKSIPALLSRKACMRRTQNSSGMITISVAKKQKISCYLRNKSTRLKRSRSAITCSPNHMSSSKVVHNRVSKGSTRATISLSQLRK